MAAKNPWHVEDQEKNRNKKRFNNDNCLITTITTSSIAYRWSMLLDLHIKMNRHATFYDYCNHFIVGASRHTCLIRNTHCDFQIFARSFLAITYLCVSNEQFI